MTRRAVTRNHPPACADTAAEQDAFYAAMADAEFEREWERGNEEAEPGIAPDWWWCPRCATKHTGAMGRCEDCGWES